MLLEAKFLPAKGKVAGPGSGETLNRIVSVVFNLSPLVPSRLPLILIVTISPGLNLESESKVISELPPPL